MTGILTIKRAIQLGVMLMEFLTMLVIGLEEIFPPRLTASDEDSDIKRKKKRLKFRNEHGKKRQKQLSKLY